MGMSAVIKLGAGGGEWVSRHLPDWLNRPTPAADWFVPIYKRMMSVGALLMLPFLLLAIFESVRQHDLLLLVKAVMLHLPLAALLTMTAVGLTWSAMQVTDGLTSYVLTTPGVNWAGFFAGLAGLFGGLVAAAGTMAISGFVPGAAAAAIAALAVLAAGVGIFIELIVRLAAIYACLLFLPLAFAGTIWPAARGWARHLVRLLLVAIMAKFVVASVVVLGVAAFGSPSSSGPLDDGGIESELIGAALLIVAFLSPLAMLRLLPFAEVALTSFNRPARLAASTVRVLGTTLVLRNLAHAKPSSTTPRPPGRVSGSEPAPPRRPSRRPEAAHRQDGA
jgi:hypothetical protein